MSTPTQLSYKDAGVDIDAGNALVDNIKTAVKRTHRPEDMGNLGGFGALCELPTKYKHPVLVSGTDGVGTKLRLAIDYKKHDTVGIDLVAMCSNDLIVSGAEPLFFLDYYATGKLDVDAATAVVKGIAEGCVQSGCALIGGETAEMPGMYEGDDYDLAGFCVGVVEKAAIIDGTKVEVSKVNPEDDFEGKPLIDHLLEPTKIYVKSLLKLLEQTEVHAMAHITGGGFWENIPRVLPDDCKAVVKGDSWQWPSIFNWLMENGNIAEFEMYRTFNCGVGMVVALPSDKVDAALKLLNAEGEKAWHIGNIAKRNGDEEQVEIL